MKRKLRRVLGPAPPGFSCVLCGQGGDDIVQIAMHRGCVGIMHRDCAREFFRKPVLEPKNRSRLGLGVVDGLSR